MLISNRKPKLMICFIRFACLPMIALAVATNSCPIIGSTYTAAESLIPAFYAVVYNVVLAIAIWRAALELSLANWPTNCCYSVLKSSRVSMGACSIKVADEDGSPLFVAFAAEHNPPISKSHSFSVLKIIVSP